MGTNEKQIQNMKDQICNRSSPFGRSQWIYSLNMAHNSDHRSMVEKKTSKKALKHHDRDGKDQLQTQEEQG